jgi:Fe-S oxidoreductase
MDKEQSLTEKYELSGCIQCGRCSAGCPISLNSALNIRKLIREVTVNQDLEPIYERGELWDCTTCSICSLRCPRGLNPHEVLINIRSTLAEEGNIPVTIRDALEGTFKHGNPYGQVKSKRSEWAADLKIKNFSQGDRAEILYFVGCAPSYDPRLQEVSRALVKTLNQAEVIFGILGNEENCCGNEIRRMGEEGLFEMLRMDNLKLFHDHRITHIVTTSSHCYNTFKNEYDDDSFKSEHYTEFVAKLIQKGKLSFSKEIKKVVTYQDPCFLGKQNGVYEEPRFILGSIPGISFVDLERCREKSLCCEGGGGRMWMDATDSGHRLGEVRIREAVALGAEIIATACPFCLLNLEDAITTIGLTDKIQVRDILELVAEAI